MNALCQSSPIFKLPTEIIVDIFMTILGVGLRSNEDHWTQGDSEFDFPQAELWVLNLTAVCSEWRAMVRSCPMMWTWMRIDPDDRTRLDCQIDRVGAFLQLSKTVPFSIKILTGEVPQLERLRALLDPHMWRCRSFAFRGTIPGAELYFPLRGELSTLRELAVDVISEDWEQRPFTMVEASDSPPPLDTVDLTLEFPLANAYLMIDWSKVRRFRFNPVEQQIDDPFLVPILCQCTGLETFLTSMSSNIHSSVATTLPALTHLGVSDDFPSHITRGIIAPSLRHLTLKIGEFHPDVGHDMGLFHSVTGLKHLTINTSQSDYTFGDLGALPQLIAFLGAQPSLEELDIAEADTFDATSATCLLHHLSSLEVDTVCETALEELIPIPDTCDKPDTPPHFLPKLLSLRIGGFRFHEDETLIMLTSRMKAALSNSRRPSLRIVCCVPPTCAGSGRGIQKRTLTQLRRLALTFPRRVCMGRHPVLDEIEREGEPRLSFGRNLAFHPTNGLTLSCVI